MSDVTQESKSSALLVWVLTFFFSVLPSLIFFFIKKEDKFVNENCKTILNWFITLFIVFLVLGVVGGVLGFIMAKISGTLAAIVGGLFFLVYLVIFVTHFICIILGALKANKGIVFKYPFSLKLIK